MFPHSDTCYAALKIERTVTLKRAERRARQLEDAKQHRSAPTVCATEPGPMRWGSITHAIRSVRWGLRPSHA